jgi:hypothetical protein
MAELITRMDDVISLAGFHREFLTAMLDEPVPQILTLGQAKLLVSSVKLLTMDCSYSSVVDVLLKDIEALWLSGTRV